VINHAITYLLLFVTSVLVFEAGEMIKDDPRNNSAWNQRWFCCHRANQEPISEELARKEMDYAIESGAKIDPYNESPWRYMIGIMKEQIKVKPNPVLIDEFLKKTTDTQSVVSDAGHDPDKCSNLVSARIDLLEMKGDSSSLEAVSSDDNKVAIVHALTLVRSVSCICMYLKYLQRSFCFPLKTYYLGHQTSQIIARVRSYSRKVLGLSSGAIGQEALGGMCTPVGTVDITALNSVKQP
jgi:hypothetical protein